MSPDPLVRANAIGQIRMGYAFGMILAGATFKDHLFPDYDLDSEPKKFGITGGGPNFRTKKVLPCGSLCIKMVGGHTADILQYDEDGEPIYKNGQPVYTYKTYENLPDPIVFLYEFLLILLNVVLLLKIKNLEIFVLVLLQLLVETYLTEVIHNKLMKQLSYFQQYPKLGKMKIPKMV